MLAATFADAGLPLVEELLVQMAVPAALAAELLAALLPEPTLNARDGDVFAAGFDAELDELRALRDHTGQFLVDLEARERTRTGIANLRVEYNRVHGFYIEVTHGQTARVPDDYRRRQTLKNAERYITPELKAFEDKALSAQERARVREKQLYDELLLRLGRHVPALLRAADAVASIDVLATFAAHAHSARWTRPTLSATPGLEIIGARHPVVERVLETYVPNDCRLGNGRRLLVITGPNMGGKSTYMRSIALVVLLAYCGSFVPAANARIGPIDRILTRIGAADDLARGASTFMVEMTEAAMILNQATDSSLVLMDEPGCEGDVIEAYADRMEDPDSARRLEAARAWCAWEDSVLSLEPQAGRSGWSDAPTDDMLAFVRICTHYLRHGAWLEEGALIRDAGRLAGTAGVLIHGRRDMSCPVETAWELASAWPGAKLVVLDDSGHLRSDSKRAALLQALDEFAQR